MMESDTLNESYICFRRCESKSVRKTRASQVTSSDKLARLQMEFHYPLEIAKLILSRETVKKEAAQQAQVVWEKRLAFMDLKCDFPTLNDKVDEELLVDNLGTASEEAGGNVRLRLYYKTFILSFIHCRRVPGLKIKTNNSPRSEPLIRPKDCVAAIREQIEANAATVSIPTCL